MGKRRLIRGGRLALHAAALLIFPFASASELPLLDRAEIRAPISAGCEGQSDDTPLPVDPRSLATPEVVSQPGAAVQFNTYWVNLRDPAAPYVYPNAPYDEHLGERPDTCGEWRASVERGRQLLQGKQYFQVFGTAQAYNLLWAVWGLPGPPADFAEQVKKRYGLHDAPFDNPYPLLTENPASSDGGSGQLPLGLIQARGPNGDYNGMLAVTCSACHDSRLGDAGESDFVQGRSSGAFDAGLLVADMAKANGFTAPMLLAPIPWSAGRGGSDAIGIIDYLGALFNMETLDMSPGMETFQNHPAAGMTKAPNWWNRAFKTRQFWDGGLSSDNVRSEMAFGVANLMLTGEQRRAMQPEFEDINNYLVSLSPPSYPGEVDESLAELGAVIFHSRDLWAGGANSDIPRQPGNGSCASCHGVYSPRYAADPNFLPDPRLKGVASVITPIETIQTDPARFRLMELEPMRRAWDSSWWGYLEMSPDFDGWNPSPFNTFARFMADYGFLPLGPEGPNKWREPSGYVAPPLYGAWAAAPYLHNGSVPDIWSLLKSSDRPDVWQRSYTEGGDGFLPVASYRNEGYNSSYAAYDFERLGWKHEELECSNSLFKMPFLPCSNEMATPDMFYASYQNAAAQYASFNYQTPPIITDQQIRSRMILNTHLYSLGNGGHRFSDALTDEERWAVIEYLKTL